MIWVDALATYPSRPFGHDRWAHLYDDAGDLAALHTFARSIGLKRAWFQASERFPHYDVTAGKHHRALLAGAHLADRQTFARHVLAAIERMQARKLQAKLPLHPLADTT